MKPYYNQNETIFDVTERFPETIEVFVRFGFEHMTNDAMRQSLGKSITIS
ncbi:MAG: hypothetical protein PWP24_881, partial [Clostridiales bacterium]|nr:hypothetical protein [Clostridiales bacterium]